MKTLLLTLVLAFSSFAFADEIPFPTNVITYIHPKLDGLPLLAVNSTEFYLADIDESQQPRPELKAQRVCKMLGHKRAFTYSLVYQGDMDTTWAMIDVNKDLVGVKTFVKNFVVDGKEYNVAVFQDLSCVKK